MQGVRATKDQFGRAPAPTSPTAPAETLPKSLVKNGSTPRALEEPWPFYMEKLEKKSDSSGFDFF